MKPSEIIYQIRELKDAWRKQDFSYSKEQQSLYDRLIELRRQRVLSFYANGQVYKGGSKQSVDVF